MQCQMGKKINLFHTCYLRNTGWICYPKHFGSLVYVMTGMNMFSLKRRFSTVRCFLWDAASVLPVYGSCSELTASSKGVCFLPFCINPKLLFLLPRHPNATTPNTVVFAGNHSRAKSVAVVFPRKDVLPKTTSHAHRWEKNHLKRPKRQ